MPHTCHIHAAYMHVYMSEVAKQQVCMSVSCMLYIHSYSTEITILPVAVPMQRCNYYYVQLLLRTLRTRVQIHTCMTFTINFSSEMKAHTLCWEVKLYIYTNSRKSFGLSCRKWGNYKVGKVDMLRRQTTTLKVKLGGHYSLHICCPHQCLE
jgi:hypothetical protein